MKPSSSARALAAGAGGLLPLLLLLGAPPSALGDGHCEDAFGQLPGCQVRRTRRRTCSAGAGTDADGNRTTGPQVGNCWESFGVNSTINDQVRTTHSRTCSAGAGD